jgi:VanZ family protein
VKRTFWDRAALVALPLYWIALFIATHYPRVRIPGEIPHSDKLIHFGAFGLLAVLFWRFVQARRPIGNRFVWVATTVLIPYAGLDEYLQQFFGRYTDFNDFIANTVGIVVALAVLETRRVLRKRRTP